MSEESLIPFLAVAAASAIVFMVVWFVVSGVLARRRARELRRMMGSSASDSEHSLAVEELLPGAPGKTPVQKFDRSFDDMIGRTGLEMDTPLALALVVMAGVILAAIVFVWRFDQEPWVAVPAFFLGCLVPLVFYIYRQQAWRRTLQNQLPDTFFLLARSMRAGKSIDQAVTLVGEQGVQPLSREFARMSRQLELGLPLSQALQISAKRLDLVDFNVFASVVGLHRTSGGNLPVLLDRLANATRDRNQFEGQYRAATVLGRYSAAFIIACVGLILVYLFFFQREWAVRFFQTNTGIALFCTALALEVLGIVLLFWLLRAEY